MKKIFIRICSRISSAFKKINWMDDVGGYILMDAEFHEYQYNPFEDDGAYADDDVD